MSAKADWHITELDLDGEPDPFEAPIEEVGTPIDLRDPKGQLHARLVELVDRANWLDSRGIQCDIKENDGTCCSACPVSKAGTKERLGLLCRLGREEEQVVTELVALDVAERAQERAAS